MLDKKRRRSTGEWPHIAQQLRHAAKAVPRALRIFPNYSNTLLCRPMRCMYGVTYNQRPER